MRAGAADIRRLAAKGLSGAEAGRLAVAHLLKIEHGKAGILGKADIEGLRACLRNQSEEDDYQRMLGLHGAARLMLAEAQIASLQIVGLLEGLRHRLECCLIWDDAVADLTEQPERTLALASRMAAVLAAYQQVLAEMGRIAHASFSSSLLGVVPFELGALLADDEGDELLDEVSVAARRYNRMVELLFEEEAEDVQPASFQLDGLEPDEATLAILRERITLGLHGPGLGSEWWL
jgi:hypothetical protein